jgi:hypothetical protein
VRVSLGRRGKLVPPTLLYDNARLALSIFAGISTHDQGWWPRIDKRPWPLRENLHGPTSLSPLQGGPSNSETKLLSTPWVSSLILVSPHTVKVCLKPYPWTLSPWGCSKARLTLFSVHIYTTAFHLCSCQSVLTSSLLKDLNWKSGQCVNIGTWVKR